MAGIFKRLQIFVWRQKSVALLLTISLLAFGSFARLGYQNFLFLQGQNLSSLSLFNEVLLPLAGIVLVLQILIASVLATRLLPYFSQRNQSQLLLLSGRRTAHLIYPQLLITVAYSLTPWILFCLVCWHLQAVSLLDNFRTYLTMAGVGLLAVLASIIAFLCSLFFRRVLTCMMLSLFILIAFLVIDSYGWTVNWRWWHGIFSGYFYFREGVLRISDVIALIGWLVGLIAFVHLKYSHLNYRHIAEKKHLILLRTLIAAGLTVVVSAGFWNAQIDLSQDKRNTLNETVLRELRKTEKPLMITAVIEKQTSRDEILKGFKVIQAGYPNTQIDFRSRQSLGSENQFASEFIEFTLGELHQVVAYPFNEPVKQVFENAILQMLARKSQWITFVEGHGEASPFAQKTSDVGTLHQLLKNMGWPVAAQNLAKTPIISDNTGLLVIASSRQQWLSSEIDLVLAYLKQGGNLLLMHDPESRTPQEILDFLNVKVVPGTLVDWNGFQGGTPHPGIVVITQLGDHPLVSELNSLLAFPWASGLQIANSDLPTPFEIKPVIQTHGGVWNELDINAETLALDTDKGEIQGAMTIAFSLTHSNTTQRILAIGDSHFASDAAINNYANQQLILNMISWLTHKPLDSAELFRPRDSYIRPNLISHWIFMWGYSLVVPLGFLSAWALMRYKRLAKV